MQHMQQQQQLSACSQLSSSSSSSRRPCRCIVKLGGSAVTLKHQHQTLKAGVLASVTAALQQLYQQTQQLEQQPGFVVLHGAGSYGHFEASRYAITKPDTPQPLLLEGFAHTRRAVMRLNQLVVNELIEAGVPAVGLSPFGFCHTRSGSLDPASEQAYVDAVQAALNSGLIPVLHGDGILESGAGRQIKPAILSGDRIMLSMAAALQPEYAVFLTDVPGLLTAPPDTPDAQLIPRVWVQAGSGAVRYELPRSAAGSQQQQGVTTSTAAHDTTGGIAAKVQAAADIVRAAAVPVIIAEAGTASGAAAVLDGVGLSRAASPACTVIAIGG